MVVTGGTTHSRLGNSYSRLRNPYSRLLSGIYQVYHQGCQVSAPDGLNLTAWCRGEGKEKGLGPFFLSFHHTPLEAMNQPQQCRRGDASAWTNALQRAVLPQRRAPLRWFSLCGTGTARATGTARTLAAIFFSFRLKPPKPPDATLSLSRLNGSVRHSQHPPTTARKNPHQVVRNPIRGIGVRPCIRMTLALRYP